MPFQVLMFRHYAVKALIIIAVSKRTRRKRGKDNGNTAIFFLCSACQA